MYIKYDIPIKTIREYHNHSFLLSFCWARTKQLALQCLKRWISRTVLRQYLFLSRLRLGELGTTVNHEVMRTFEHAMLPLFLSFFFKKTQHLISCRYQKQKIIISNNLLNVLFDSFWRKPWSFLHSVFTVHSNFEHGQSRHFLADNLTTTSSILFWNHHAVVKSWNSNTVLIITEVNHKTNDSSKYPIRSLGAFFFDSAIIIKQI